jgi:tRNA pseudouridine55 synthase
VGSKIENRKSKIKNSEGLLVIDKPSGWTSHDVVARARRLLGERRIGHTGTLDPFATGVLVLLVGRATRLAQFLSGDEKEYEAVVRFGHSTDTGDLTGARVGGAQELPGWGWRQMEAALRGLTGEIDQIPPMYSAKKVQGQKLYELARRGVEVEREPVRVRVRVFEFDHGRQVSGPAFDAAGGTFDLPFRVVCSAGTYVRVLAESLGRRLGTGAHLAALRRTRAGEFHVSRAVGLERLAELSEAGRAGEAVVPVNAALSGWPARHLTDAEAARVRNGVAVGAGGPAAAGWAEGAPVRLCGEGGELLAVGVYDAARGLLLPRVMLAGAENKS